MRALTFYTFTFLFLICTTALYGEGPLKLSLEPKQIEEVAAPSENLGDELNRAPQKEIKKSDDVLEKEKSLFKRLKKVEVEMSEEGEPIIGYRFSEKSEASKRADRDLSEIEGGSDSPFQEGITGRIVDGKIE